MRQTIARNGMRSYAALMQRREFIREPSKSARMSLPPAALSLVLFAVSTLSHWFGLLSAPNFVLVLLVAFIFGAIGIALALFGFRALWKRAAVGGTRSFFAILLASPVMITGLLAGLMSQLTPRISDISTDLTDPPHFQFSDKTAGITNTLEPPRINPQAQAEYEGLSGRRYSLSADMISGKIMDLVEFNGWKPATPFPVRRGQDEWLIEATIRTPLFGFRDAVVIRVTEEGEAAYVDMRSASGFGEADLGANATRIKKFMKDLDTQISLGTTLQQ